MVAARDRWSGSGTPRLLGMLAGVALLAAAAPGCGGGQASSADAEASGKATVVIANGAYVPARVRVEVGDRVTWFNRDQAPNTAETDGSGLDDYDRDRLAARNIFDIHTLQQGEAESVEFDTAGVYEYHSSLNADMKGVVEVVEADE